MEVLVYDGSFVGYLTLLSFLIEREALLKANILNQRLDKRSQALLFYKRIHSDEERARALLEKVHTFCGFEYRRKLFIYYLCDSARLEKPLARVLKRVFTRKGSVEDLTDEDVILLYRVEREFFRERHRFYGLLRFIQVPEGPLIAVFEPKYNVLPKLYQHFVRRFPNEDFIIIDRKRGLVFSYLRRKGSLFWVDELEIELDPKVDPVIALWQRYFKEIAVEERISHERQRSRLPLRVRKFLPEFWSKE